MVRYLLKGKYSTVLFVFRIANNRPTRERKRRTRGLCTRTLGATPRTGPHSCEAGSCQRIRHRRPRRTSRAFCR